ncbi:hypothetical protein SLEP1_g31697 [Rubroshorea leprosula]|uniref:RRM domain-containing protein n=1 Tax=Rubroshorea leprosula TaxID=152421 RepID=A0AAV5KBA3_9ROSI|nr:hypothetical protein SLEP1_g31697 [Rubroshorea leprosula]
MSRMERERARVRDRFPTARDSGNGFRRRRLPGYGKHFIGQATTYFFYDFPAKHSAKDLWYRFWSFGKVADVYIPERRDRRGRRFGFVRMAEVSDVRDMERKLNQIWLGSYRLKVKLAKNMKSEREGIYRGNQQNQTTAQWLRRDKKVSPGLTYAQIVTGKILASDEGEAMTQVLEQAVVQKVPEKRVAGLEQTGALSKEWAVIPVSIPVQASTSTESDANAKAYVPEELVLQFSPREDEIAWLKQSRVALVRSLDLVMKIQNRLDVDGVMVNVALLGGRHVLLMDNTEGYLEEFIDKNKELVEFWFEWIQPTSLYTMPSRNRLVWLRFNGVPLRAWSERCFSELAGLIGEVILVDDDTKFKSFLSEGRVLVLCDDSMKISQTINLMVDGESFLIKVSEEEWRMDPDRWLASERRSSGTGLDVSDMESENSEDRYSEGDDRAVMAEDCAETEAESKLSLKQNCVQNFELDGPELDGLSNVGSVGPRECEAEELGVANGSREGLRPAGVQQKGAAVLIKKCKKLGDIYAGDGVAEETREMGLQWVTARTRWRKERRETVRQLEHGTESQNIDFSLSDGCIQNRNALIRQQLELDEGMRREILKLVKKENPDFLCLQETKLEVVEESLCRALWYSENFDWVMQKSMGNSGGLLCIWNKSCFIKKCVIEGSGFIGVSGEWGKERKKCNLINVYAPCDRQGKVLLWEELAGRVLEEGGCWLFAGDFNAVRNVSERKGRMRETQDMQDFNHFVESTGLIDVGLRNRKFTWYRPDGSSMSRLDRFLMSTEMSLLATDWVQEGVARSVSDHCAIILKARNTDWGPKPFQVMDVWQQHPDFRSFVDDKWKAMQVEGWAAYKCKQKLKLMKDECKRWNKEVFGNVETRWGILSKEIEELDIKSEKVELDENEVVLRRECFQEMWEILRKREAMWKQKSRNNWIRLGDANTAFFHRCVHARRAQNAISGILGEDGWVEEPSRVKEEAVRYFSQLFQNEQWKRPVLGGIHFNRISAAQREWLERPFSVEEIEEGLQSCDGAKAPGPDGYNFNFIKFAWSTLKEDFVKFLCEFHQHGRLVKGLNSSFLALIPKKANPVHFKEYRPISLIGCLYKLLAKILANRLKLVMTDIISDSKSAFVGGRQLVDSVLILNEVVDEVKQRKQESFIFKADFEKAYDCVDWNFLDWMMEQMGFGVRWRKWIQECLSTTRISILINGSPTKEFSVGKGLRQGDPLSPFLFLLVGEGLCGMVRKAEAEGLFSGVKIGEGEGWVNGAADILHCKIGTMPFIYLGLPVGGISGRKKFWVSVLDRFRNKLAAWKRSLLSFGGRITLLNSVLSALPIFYLSLFKIPNCVLGEMVKIQRDFFWGGTNLDRKIAWVRWDHICVDKERGGLGVDDLKRRNWALLGKWWFRLGDGVGGLWKRVIWEKYYRVDRRVILLFSVLCVCLECGRTLWVLVVGRRG